MNHDDRNTIGYKLGYYGGLMGIACFISVVIALTIKIIQLLLF